MSQSTHRSNQLTVIITQRLERAVVSHASDIQIVPGYPPVYRIHCDLAEWPVTRNRFPF